MTAEPIADLYVIVGVGTDHRVRRAELVDERDLATCCEPVRHASARIFVYTITVAHMSAEAYFDDCHRIEQLLKSIQRQPWETARPAVLAAVCADEPTST